MNTQTREAWLEGRRAGIGGSDIAAIVGLSKWRTAYDIWLDKTGQAEEQEDNERMYWGRVLEDIVAKEYQTRTERKVQRVNAQLIHPSHSWMMANLDRAVINPEISGTVRWKDGRLTTDRILECKTGDARTAQMWGEEGSDFAPDYYVVQCQWYAAVCNVAFVDLAVLIGGNDYRVFTIARDDELIADLMEEGEKFWSLVQRGIAPDPQSLEDVKRMWPQSQKGKSLIVDVTAAQKVGILAEIAEQEKRLKAQKEAIMLDLLSAIEDAEDIVFQHGGEAIATYKTQATNRIDTTALKQDLPDIAAAYTKTSTTRVFRTTKAAKEL